MSYTRTYIVSTTHKCINMMAIISSGNSRAAMMKFLFHVHPSCDEKSIKLISRSRESNDHSTYYEVHDKDGKFGITVRKINIKKDFIPIYDHCHDEYKTE